MPCCTWVSTGDVGWLIVVATCMQMPDPCDFALVAQMTEELVCALIDHSRINLSVIVCAWVGWLDHVASDMECLRPSTVF